MRLKRLFRALLLLLLCFALLTSGARAAAPAPDVLTPCVLDLTGCLMGYEPLPESSPRGEISDFSLDSAYDTICTGVQAFPNALNLEEFHLTFDELTVLLKQMFADHPEFFYLTGFFTAYCDSFDTVIYVQFEYIEEVKSDNAVRRFNAAGDEALMEALGSLTGAGLTNLQKCLLLHDYLALHMTYDYDVANTPGAVISPILNSAFALVNGNAVCGGYAQAYRYLLWRVGIPAGTVGSEAMAHDWNWVKLNGERYHVDVTWDDAGTGPGSTVSDCPGYCRHDYFLRSSTGFPWVEGENRYDHYAYFEKNDVFDPSACTSTRYETGYVFNNCETAFYLLDKSLYYVENDALKKAETDLRGAFAGVRTDTARIRDASVNVDILGALTLENSGARTLSGFSMRSGRRVTYDLSRYGVSQEVADYPWAIGLRQGGTYSHDVQLVLTGGRAPVVCGTVSLRYDREVTFDAMGGRLPAGEPETRYYFRYYDTYSCNGQAPLPIPQWDGYAFLGWYTDEEDLITDDTPMDSMEEHTLYAKWKANTYTVVLDYSEVEDLPLDNRPEALYLTYGEDTFADLPEYFKDGKMLQWYTSSIGGYRILNSKTMSFPFDYVLHARLIDYRLTIDSIYFNGGTLTMYLENIPPEPTGANVLLAFYREDGSMIQCTPHYLEELEEMVFVWQVPTPADWANLQVFLFNDSFVPLCPGKLLR